MTPGIENALFCVEMLKSRYGNKIWLEKEQSNYRVQVGTLYGISLGTGDPELITVKGLRILQSSPVVAFPAGINHRPGIAQNIISPWLIPYSVPTCTL